MSSALRDHECRWWLATALAAFALGELGYRIFMATAKFGVEQLFAPPALLLLLLAMAIFAFGLHRTWYSQPRLRTALALAILALLTYAAVATPEVGFFLQAHRPWAGLLLGAAVAVVGTAAIRFSQVSTGLAPRHTAAVSTAGTAVLVWLVGLISMLAQ